MRQKVKLARDGGHVAEGVGGKIDPPGIKGWHEIKERDVAWPLIDRRRVLEGCDDHPVDREQHEERPDGKEAVDDQLCHRCHLADGRRLEHPFEQAAVMQIEFAVRLAHARAFRICPRTT